MADTPEDDVVTDLAPDPAAETPRRRRALALWGVLTVIVLGAGVLVVQSHDEDPPRLPISLGSSGGAGAAGAEQAKVAGPTSDMAMYRPVHYVAGDDLPLLGGSGPAYRLHGGVTDAQVRALARALGLTGEPKQDGTHWTLATGAGRLEVDDGGGGTWWYTSAAAMGPSGDGTSGVSAGSSSGGGTAEAGPPDVVLDSPVPPDAPVTTVVGGDVAVSNCPENAKCADPAPFVPPADLPSEAEARAKALDLLRSVGADVDDAKVHVDGPYEGWYVTVEPRVDGLLAAGLSYSVEVGSKGAIRTAGGTLARPDRLGDYPVLDTRAAIDRLNSESAVAYGATDELTVLDAPMCETASASGSATDDGVSRTDVVTEECAAGDPPSTEPYVPPEPQTIVLHGAERVLTVVYASDGSTDAYLVPGYRFTGDQDALFDQVAIDDDSLAPSSPVENTKVVPTEVTDPGEVPPTPEATVGEPK